MARRKYQMDEKKIARFIKEGRGQGEGANYNPWLHVDDLSSKGRSHRAFCPKTGREMQLLSDNEYGALLIQWWDDDVIDIREQFPLLDREETLEIALRCGFKHPEFHGALTVVTTDLLVTLRRGCGKPELRAHAVKEESDLSDETALKNLEIERRYWERRDIPWSFITNIEAKNIFISNLAWILDPDRTLYIDVHDRSIDETVLVELVSAQLMYPRVPIRLVCQFIDQKLHYRRGTSLAAIRRLLCAKRLHTDLDVLRLQDVPLGEYETQKGVIESSWNHYT